MKQATQTTKRSAPRKPGDVAGKAGKGTTPARKPAAPLPTLEKIYYGPDRDAIIQSLHRKHPGFTFRIGVTRLGDPQFTPEYQKLEILSQFRPTLHDRVNRFAVYGGKA